MPDAGDPAGGDDEAEDRRERRPRDRTGDGDPGPETDPGAGTAGPDRNDEPAPVAADDPPPAGSGVDRRPGPDRPSEDDRRSETDRPAPQPTRGSDDDGELLAFLREVATTVGAVVAVGLVLFAVSGVWPPLVAVESGSMEPHMYKGDLVFIVEDGRFAGGGATEGVVTYRVGRETGYWSFGNYGNVVVYRPHVEAGEGYRATNGPPIIHRAQFYVERGEDWVAMADDRYLGSVDSCGDVGNCPAPHDGFVTKGDANGVYDQVTTRSTVVKAEWIRGVAKVRIPWLGCVRLQLSGDGCF